MNAIELAQRAYAPTISAVRTPRSSEHQLFTQITARLRHAKNHADLVRALHDNRKLWTTLAVDVADNDNGLPEPLRAQIFYLAEFTQQHTSKVLRRQADPDTLIDINDAILGGLAPIGAVQ